jgi:PBP1b-binding outer membrane lipoprotein LpoB
MKKLIILLIMMAVLFWGCVASVDEPKSETEVKTETITETETIHIKDPVKIWLDKIVYLKY